MRTALESPEPKRACGANPAFLLVKGVLQHAMVMVLVAGGWLLPVASRAAALEGHVVNGTSEQPVSGATVQLIQLQQGMTPVASATTDTRGLFRFDGVESFGASPAMLQVEFQGTTYTQPVLSLQSPASNLQVTVFEASRDHSLISVVEHAIFLRPAAGQLAVIEQISIENRSNPPRAYVNPEGTYVFTLPGAPRDGVEAAIQGAAGMPIPQQPVPLDRPNSFAITYPIRPGESQVRLQYTLDYQPPYDFTKFLNLPGQQTHIVTPGEGVQLTGENLTALGREPTTGLLAYQVTPAAGIVKLQISGEAPATQTAGPVAEPTGPVGLFPIPDAATEQRWLILSALGLILLAGLVYLYKD